MGVRSANGGERRRALLREVIGGPGSLVRWLVFTGVWLVVCLVVFAHVGWMLRIAVFLFAVVVPFSAFRARSLLVGDEDKLRAAVKEQTRRAAEDGPIEDDGEGRLAPEDWLSRGGRIFGDVPPPPISDETQDVPSN